MSGVRIALRWDDSQLRGLLAALRARMHDMTPFFREAGEIILEGVQRSFELQRSPDGAPWPPLKYPREQGHKILIRTGRLLRSIYRRASRRRVEVGTNVVYAAIHQFGGRTRPHQILPRRARALRWTSGGQTVFARRVSHPGSDIPARSFLGIDREAWAELVDAAEHWLEAAS